jgi:hypothetical protein
MKAFPHEEWLDSTDPKVVNPIRHPGMDLRDYFAGLALQGLLSNSEDDFDDELLMRESYHDYCMIFASSAYEMADAMMEARNGN